MTDAADDVSTPLYKRPKVVLWTITAVWLSFAIFVVVKRNQCGDIDVGLLQGLLGLHQHYLACRPLNELGDFLAGVFAPLAFIWLAGAVYIQSQELKAQHRQLRAQEAEMKAQKIEMAASARAMELQAAATEATKEFIRKQTVIMEDQYNAAKEALKADAFRSFLRAFYQLQEARGDLRLTGVVRIYGSTQAPVMWSQVLAEPSRTGDLGEFVYTMARRAAEAQGGLVTRRSDAILSVDQDSVDRFDHAIEGLTKLREQQLKLSAPYAPDAALLPLQEVLDEWKTLRAFLDGLERRQKN